MGVRSDVFICVKNLAHDEMDEPLKRMLKEGYGAEVYLNPEGAAYVIEDVKWYFDSYEELIRLYAYLKTLDAGDYAVIVACHDYPESTDGDQGGWLDNPWGARRVSRVSIEFDALAY